jgi:hypothetical protein
MGADLAVPVAAGLRGEAFGATPCRRATEETDSPGSQLASMIRSFCSIVQRRRRAVPVISSIR